MHPSPSWHLPFAPPTLLLFALLAASPARAEEIDPAEPAAATPTAPRTAPTPLRLLSPPAVPAFPGARTAFQDSVPDGHGSGHSHGSSGRSDPCADLFPTLLGTVALLVLLVILAIPSSASPDDGARPLAP